MAPCCCQVTHYDLQTSMRHVTTPIFLQFLNTISVRLPT